MNSASKVRKNIFAAEFLNKKVYLTVKFQLNFEYSDTSGNSDEDYKSI